MEIRNQDNLLDELEKRFIAFANVGDLTATDYFRFINETYPLNSIIQSVFASHRSMLGFDRIKSVYEAIALGKVPNFHGISSAEQTGFHIFHSLMIDGLRKAGFMNEETIIPHTGGVKKETLASIGKQEQKSGGDFVITRNIQRQIILNNQYVLSRPNFFSENDVFFEFVITRPNQKIKRDDIREVMDKDISKNFHQIILDLGFVGELKKLFFSSVSKNTVIFNNHIAVENIKNYGVDLKTLQSELMKLKKLPKTIRNDKK